MSFLHILRECNLDFNKAKEVYGNLTDLQIAWLNAVVKKEEDENTQRTYRNVNNFGEETRSFDMRQERR